MQLGLVRLGDGAFEHLLPCRDVLAPQCDVFLRPNHGDALWLRLPAMAIVLARLPGRIVGRDDVLVEHIGIPAVVGLRRPDGRRAPGLVRHGAAQRPEGGLAGAAGRLARRDLGRGDRRVAAGRGGERWLDLGPLRPKAPTPHDDHVFQLVQHRFGLLRIVSVLPESAVQPLHREHSERPCARALLHPRARARRRLLVRPEGCHRGQLLRRGWPFVVQHSLQGAVAFDDHFLRRQRDLELGLRSFVCLGGGTFPHRHPDAGDEHPVDLRPRRRHFEPLRRRSRPEQHHPRPFPLRRSVLDLGGFGHAPPGDARRAPRCHTRGLRGRPHEREALEGTPPLGCVATPSEVCGSRVEGYRCQVNWCLRGAEHRRAMSTAPAIAW
mmetsp:Transcript_126026/g.362483  ORF Transcript_126026/g.362483 Transcript_126026/m.362483 type:complete len:381 (-) Transcript_126026:283-1425(-)